MKALYTISFDRPLGAGITAATVWSRRSSPLSRTGPPRSAARSAGSPCHHASGGSADFPPPSFPPWASRSLLEASSDSALVHPSRLGR